LVGIANCGKPWDIFEILDTRGAEAWARKGKLTGAPVDNLPLVAELELL